MTQYRSFKDKDHDSVPESYVEHVRHRAKEHFTGFKGGPIPGMGFNGSPYPGPYDPLDYTPSDVEVGHSEPAYLTGDPGDETPEHWLDAEMEDREWHDVEENREYYYDNTLPQDGLLPPEELGTNPKDLIGVKKPSARFTPTSALIHLYMVMKNGAQKYGEMNWRKNKVQQKVYLDAIDRHLMLLADGENYDLESGHHHAAHIMACCAIILDAQETGNLIDDRNKTHGVVRRLLDGFTES